MIRHLAIYGLTSLLILGIPSRVQSQVKEDSIDQHISLLPDSLKLGELTRAANSFQYSSLSKALKYADQRLTIASRINDPNQVAATYNLYGNLYLESGLYSNAEKYYRIAYEIYDSLGNNEGLATECHNLGLVYYNRGDTIKSLNYYRESVFVRKSTGNARRIGDGLTTLGEAYLMFRDYDQSITCLFEALDYYNDTVAYPRKIDCLAFIVDNLLVKSPAKALKWIEAMQEDNRVLKRRSYDQMISLRLASYYLASGNINSCLNHLEKVNTDSIFMYEVSSPVKLYINVSEKLLETGDIQKGLLYSRIARELHQKQESHHTADMSSEFKTRLNLRIADEELRIINDINRLMLQRIRIEEYIKHFMIIAAAVLSILALFLLSSLLSLRYNAVVLRNRKKELEEALERSLKYKERILKTRENKNVFFKMISGKLDIPFRSLTSELDKLVDITEKGIVKDLFLRKLEEILLIGSAIEKSLKRVLLWSKLQRNRYEVHKTDINVSDYLHELLPDILGLALKKDIRVRFDIEPNIMISYDRHSLKTIIRILVENSVDYSDPKTDIIIRGQSARSGIIISVTDSGAGIPGWLQNNIFDIERDRENKETTQKLGIGLLIAKQMAEINNSYISFESNLDKGTTFFIHITEQNGREEINV